MSYGFSNTTNTVNNTTNVNNNANSSLGDDSKNDIKPDNSVNIQDSISSLAWMNMNNTSSNFFASVGWDSALRLY